MAEEKTNNGKDDGPTFSVHNVYVKDISFEGPNSPSVFSEKWQPKLDFDLQMGHQSLADGIYEVVLNVTVNVKLGESEKVAFIIEVQQAGVFSINGFSDEQVEQVLATTAPGILFPYVRETVSSCVTRGGFPQLVLPPMNFDAMYHNHLEENKKSAAQDGK